MTEQAIKQTVFQLLKKIAPDTSPETLQPDDDIRRTLEIDSFDALQFVVALNENYGIEIPEDDYGKINTLRKVINYIQQKLNS